MAEEKPTDEAQASPPKKSKKWLLLTIGVIVLGGGAAATAFFMTRGAEPVDPDGSSPAAVEESLGLVPLDTFLVNLNDPRGERYMKVTMRLTLSPESTADKILEDELKLARIRDRVLTVLMSKSFEELSDPLGKESLRLEVQAQVDTLLADGAVHDVLFSEWVVQ